VLLYSGIWRLAAKQIAAVRRQETPGEGFLQKTVTPDCFFTFLRYKKRKRGFAPNPTTF
jgi:hypothetical protein